MQKPIKKGLSYYLWACLFFIFMGGIIIGLYYSTLKIDYVWRWYRVPQYFFYKDVIDVKSEVQGEVKSISTKQGKTVVVVKADEKEETYEIIGDKIVVGEGDFISMGDVLGSYQKWRIGILIEGLWLTLEVSFIAIIFGVIIGLFGGLARISQNPAFRWSAITYIELIRGSPLLVQIFIWYFVLGTLINNLLAKNGFPQIEPIIFGIASLATFSGAYVAEIVRAGIQSIHRGQMEAARSLGMNYAQSMIYIILPQAFLRIMPPLAGQFISLVKDSSLLGIIAIRELSKATREVVTSSLQPFEIWFVCALLYLILTFSLSMFAQYLEKRIIK